MITWGGEGFLDELVTASLLDIVRVDNAQKLINEGVITDLKDGKKLLKLQNKYYHTIIVPDARLELTNILLFIVYQTI